MKIDKSELQYEPVDEAESQETSPLTVVLAALLISIPLGLCCYYFLR